MIPYNKLGLISTILYIYNNVCIIIKTVVLHSAFKNSNQYRPQNNGDNRLLSNLSACYDIVEKITTVRHTRRVTLTSNRAFYIIL